MDKLKANSSNIELLIELKIIVSLLEERIKKAEGFEGKPDGFTAAMYPVIEAKKIIAKHERLSGFNIRS